MYNLHQYAVYWVEYVSAAVYDFLYPVVLLVSEPYSDENGVEKMGIRIRCEVEAWYVMCQGRTTSAVVNMLVLGAGAE